MSSTTVGTGIPASHQRGKVRRSKQAMGAAIAVLLGSLVAPFASAVPTTAAPIVGQGFVVTPADLDFILQQIKIAEAHVANTTSLTGPCGALVGDGPDQIVSPLLSARSAHRGRVVQQPAARPGDLRRSRPGLPTSDYPDLPAAESNPPLFGPPGPAPPTPRRPARCSTPSRA